MVVDTSAALAILLQEPRAPAFARAIEDNPRPVMSAASVIEAGIVLIARYGPRGRRHLDQFLTESRLQVAPITADHVAVALDAFQRFGKGRHRAALNFGDCFSYALAKTTGRLLLFEGNDFALTDLSSWPPE